MFKFLKRKKKNEVTQSFPKKDERKKLEEKAVEGARKALKEYGRVFERLAQYDRT